MLFQSSIRRELARSFGATLVVLITIVMTIVLIRTLGQASRGSIDPQDVMLFMAYSAMGRLPTILSLSLFIAMVSTLSRMYRDSEMVVWFSSGQGLWCFLRPLYRFAWPVLLIITLMSMFVWPWANQQTQDMRERYESRSDLDRIAPGQFQESSNGSRVFFIDANTESAKKASSNVFISANTNGKNTIITANAGRIEMRGNDQLLLLENGQRIERLDDKNALKISEFQEYGTKTGGTDNMTADATEAKLLSTRDLIKAPTPVNRSELAWRLGLLLSAINLVVLAVALASVNPRGGRSGNMIFVLLTFIVYNNLLNLGQNWIYSGMVSFSGFIVTLHGGVLLLGLTWLAKRHSNWTIRSMFSAKRRSVDNENTSA